MSVPVRPKSLSINRVSFLASTSVFAVWHLWPLAASGEVAAAMAELCFAVGAVAGTRQAVMNILKDYRLRRDLAKTQTASDDHGTGREAEWAEIVARAMHDPASGNLLGLFAGKHAVFTPRKTPFCLIEAPPGAGKTIYLVIASILHQARLGKSLFIPDVKTELAPMLVGVLRALGFEVWCINPARVHETLCPDTELNLFQPVLDAIHDAGEFRRDAIKIALDFADLQLPEPKGGEDKNVFFRNGSRRCLIVATLSQALLMLGHCTPSDVFALLADPKAFRKRLLYLRFELVQHMPDDPIAAFLAAEAGNLLAKFEANAEHADSFMEGATQTLIAFNHGGRLAGYGRTATVNIADLRKRQIIVFVMSPLSHTRDFAPMVSLLNHSLLEAAKRDPAGYPIHIVGEEFLHFRMSDVASAMETMRGLRLSMDIYIQSFQGLVRKIGSEAAQAVEAYSDTRIFLGINSFQRARHVSDMLAESTIRRQDYSFGAEAEEINVSSRELGRRLMTPDEILAMPRDQAWVFVRGLRPLKLTMVDYGRITPWRDEVAANPLEGSALRGKPLVTIRYPAKGEGGKPVLVNAPRPPIRRVKEKHHFVWPILLRHLLWVPPALGLWLVAPLDVPMPHFLGAYSYTPSGYGERIYRQCSYLGPHGRVILPPDGQCPFVAFLSSAP